MKIEDHPKPKRLGRLFYLLPVKVDGVVVVTRVHDLSGPLAPAGWNVTAVVLVQVLAEVARSVAGAG